MEVVQETRRRRRAPSRHDPRVKPLWPRSPTSSKWPRLPRRGRGGAWVGGRLWLLRCTRAMRRAGATSCITTGVARQEPVAQYRSRSSALMRSSGCSGTGVYESRLLLFFRCVKVMESVGTRGDNFVALTLHARHAVAKNDCVRAAIESWHARTSARGYARTCLVEPLETCASAAQSYRLWLFLAVVTAKSLDSCWQY